jgi:hypothetical protein
LWGCFPSPDSATRLDGNGFLFFSVWVVHLRRAAGSPTAGLLREKKGRTGKMPLMGFGASKLRHSPARFSLLRSRCCPIWQFCCLRRGGRRRRLRAWTSWLTGRGHVAGVGRHSGVVRQQASARTRTRTGCQPAPCWLGLSATGQQYFSLRTNQPPTTSQQ